MDKLKFGQEIVSIGNSLGIIIPAFFLKDFKVEKGEVLKVTLEKVKNNGG